MSDLTLAMQTALDADAPLVFLAVRIDLPSGTLRLVDGAGSVIFAGETYVGRDDNFGRLAAIEASDDGQGDQVPAMSVTIQPPSDTVAAALNVPGVQGAAVQLWLGAVTRSTGAVVADPYLMFLGEVDQPTLTATKGSTEIEFACVSAMERLFENEEGIRLSDSFHKLLFPGETGLANVTGVTKKVYWGVEGSGGAISK